VCYRGGTIEYVNGYSHNTMHRCVHTNSFSKYPCRCGETALALSRRPCLCDGSALTQSNIEEEANISRKSVYALAAHVKQVKRLAYNMLESGQSSRHCSYAQYMLDMVEVIEARVEPRRLALPPNQEGLKSVLYAPCDADFTPEWFAQKNRLLSALEEETNVPVRLTEKETCLFG
jgi:hypothetical protein